MSNADCTGDTKEFTTLSRKPKKQKLPVEEEGRTPPDAAARG
jgi:hypothetical protein